MSELTKEVIIGAITILQDRQMQIREDTIVFEDGVEVAKTYFRYTASPGEDISSRPAFVQELAAFLWTPEVIANFKHKFPFPVNGGI